MKSSDTDALEPTKVPCAIACTMNSPVGLVVPCPDIVVPVGSIWADPDDIMYVVPAMVRLPLASDRVYPCILRAGWGVELASGTMAAMNLDARTRVEDLSAAELEALAAALGPPRSG